MSVSYQLFCANMGSMGKVINIEDALKQCKIEVININAKDLLLPEYQSLFFGLFVQQLFIYEPKKQESFSIDGYNRTQTIKKFFNEEFQFPLDGLSKFNWQYN